ncbi:MAG TPA: NAD(P)H-dependent oxidoreductase [Candidatus Angelobacter sp.]|jgi:FMN-dependent NADH-azoreductase|nr:NAD(P)H-dependent oxidoreductase [Candidatus Angelobacter sp.]
MPTLLIVNSSPRSNSVSSSLTRQFAQDWKAKHPDGLVMERNLSDTSIPLLNEAWIAAAYTPESHLSEEQRALLALSDQLIGEVMAADVILLGVPMHNFSVPAAFKAWIDQIARVGKTFSYSDQGPKALIPANKKVIAVVTRGGAFASEASASDHVAAYLRQVLGFVGLTDITFVHADRQSMGAEAASRSVATATLQIKSLFENYAAQQAA